MTVVTRIPRTSRISQMIDKPGGVSVGVALAQADRNLEALREQAMERVSDAVAVLAAVPPPVTELQKDVAAREAYAAASDVIDAAGPFGQDDLCTAAAGLCDLIDDAGADIDWRIITVHAQSLRMLLTLPKEDRDSREAILGELRRVLERRLGGAPAV